MQRSYLVRRAVNYADFNFFIKAGDILVHDPSNSNRLTVYRGGEIVKTFTQTSLGIAAMVKNGYIVEASTVKPAPKAAPKPVEAPKPAGTPKLPEAAADAPQTPPTPTAPTQKHALTGSGQKWDAKAKRGKAQPKEVSQDDPEFRRRMGWDPIPDGG
jgi:hypothetical protein